MFILIPYADVFWVLAGKLVHNTGYRIHFKISSYLSTNPGCAIL